MHRARLCLRFALATWLTVSGALTGCAQHRIPAIDPTGQQIFSGTTTLAHDLFHRRQEVQPVAAVPVVPAQPVLPVQPLPVQPPCSPPVMVVPIAAPPAPAGPVQTVLPSAPRQAGPLNETCPPEPGPELKVTPGRIVAPVGTEVVLAAGICSPDGYYITKQPLEWMLAQDGAGQIVAVGHESPHNVSLLLRNSPQKVATNYARAHTSTISQVLDRGTPTHADDVYLHKGQSWITITSPTEGTSHVVVWAPKEHNWERRKATATIHWIDAAWKFPPCAVARAGGRQTLTTILTRSSGQPLNGWIVRYEVTDGPAAVFSARGNTAIEIPTDAAGRATVELLPRSLEPGITIVRMQVVRPGTARGDLPQMVVGQGATSVQWTTPGLTMRAIGTSSVTADGAIGYRVEVSNGGELVTRGVSLSFTPPPGVNLVNSNPAAQLFGQRYEWRLGDLQPRTTTAVELTCRASVTASIRSCFRATSADQLTAEACAATEVRTNSLEVKMTGPDAVEVGREARFLVDVINTGQTALTNVTASDTFDLGLAHSGGEPSPVTRTLVASLAPGQTHRFGLTFIVTRPGRQCHRLDVTADGGQVAAARACVTGMPAAVSPPPPAATQRALPPAPATPQRPLPTEPGTPPRALSAEGKLTVSVGAVANPIAVGATTTFVINVANEKNVPDRDVAISLQVVGDGMSLARMSGPAAVLRSAANSAEFAPVREVRAGESLPPFRVEVQGVKAGPQKLRVTVTSSGSPSGVASDGDVTVNLR